jgi:hypothetical protein
LFTCGDNSLDGGDGRLNSDVKYSADWKYITLYLDGVTAPPSPNISSRAMTPDTARRGFDFFEVFFYNGSSFASASWELGKRASVYNVYRTESGVNYGGTNAASAPCAILFAGVKQDRTLLAVGRLFSVDDAPTTVITDASVYVTFELSALTSGTNTAAASSSFLTAAKTSPYTAVSAANTDVISALIGAREFPLYRLPPAQPAVNAEYKIGFDGSWQFENSIIVADIGYTDKRKARYPAGNGWYYYARYGEDQTTVVNMKNNQMTAVGSALQNPIEFSFDTSKTISPIKPDNGIFSFAFTIPVCAIKYTAGVIPWHIRPAYASYYYNIDNGLIKDEMKDYTDVNNGGAVLCGVDVPSNFEVFVDRLR